MSDEEEDRDLIDNVARGLIDTHGQRAEGYARERAEIADAQRDPLSADARRELAEAIKRLLN
jgi:hypothetical protein